MTLAGFTFSGFDEVAVGGVVWAKAAGTWRRARAAMVDERRRRMLVAFRLATSGAVHTQYVALENLRKGEAPFSRRLGVVHTPPPAMTDVSAAIAEGR